MELQTVLEVVFFLVISGLVTKMIDDALENDRKLGK